MRGPSSTCVATIRRLFAPNHRCPAIHWANSRGGTASPGRPERWGGWGAMSGPLMSDGGLFDAIADRAGRDALQPEPVEVVGAQRQEIRIAANGRKARVPEHLD